MGLWETVISPLEKPKSQLVFECQNLFLNLVELDLLQYWVIYVKSAPSIYNLVKAQLQVPPLSHLYLIAFCRWRKASSRSQMCLAVCRLNWFSLTITIHADNKAGQSNRQNANFLYVSFDYNWILIEILLPSKYMHSSTSMLLLFFVLFLSFILVNLKNYNLHLPDCFLWKTRIVLVCQHSQLFKGMWID